MKHVWIVVVLGWLIAVGRAEENATPAAEVAASPKVTAITVTWGPTVPGKVVTREAYYPGRLADVIEYNLRAYGLFETAVPEPGATPSGGLKLTVMVKKFSAKGAVIGFGTLGAPELAGSVELLGPDGKSQRSFEVAVKQFMGMPAGSTDGTPAEWLAQQFAGKVALALRATPSLPTPAAAASPSAGQARIVVFRQNNFLRMGAGPKLFVDGRQIGPLNVGRCFSTEVSAGVHTLSTAWSGLSASTGFQPIVLEVECAEGETRYFEYVYREEERKSGLLTSTQVYSQKLVPVDETTGRAAAAKLKK